MNGFTEPTPHNASARGYPNFTTGRLIPDMNFSCNGEIVCLKIAGQLRSDEQYSQYPKLEIWRLQNRLNSYIWTGSEVVLNSSMCSMGTWTNVTDSSDVYQCSLKENAYVSFQRGDVIALILPPLKDAKFLLYFSTQSGPTNKIYSREYGKPNNIRFIKSEKAQPQISLEMCKFLSWCQCVCIIDIDIFSQDYIRSESVQLPWIAFLHTDNTSSVKIILVVM